MVGEWEGEEWEGEEVGGEWEVGGVRGGGGDETIPYLMASGRTVVSSSYRE